MSEGLKPCPCCGSMPEIKRGTVWWYIQCEDCGLRTIMMPDRAEVVRRWNYRWMERKIDTALETAHINQIHALLEGKDAKVDFYGGEISALEQTKQAMKGEPK